MNNHSHRPRKRFGQHFLRDPQVIQHIVDCIHPQANQHLIEIGPGEGVITDLIAPATTQFDLIEIDRDLAAHLITRYQEQSHITINNQDVLEFDFKTLSAEPHDLRIVGNLPYNISTPLLFHLFSTIEIIADMHFMLQREVILRMCAPQGDSNYNRLSVMTQYYCYCENLFDIPPSAFFPPPKVDSAFIRLTPQEPEVKAKDINLFSHIVKTAFTHRRKTLNNNLKKIINAETLATININASKRPQELSVNDFVNISNLLYNRGSKGDTP